MESVNPHTGQIVQTYEAHTDELINEQLQASDIAFQNWRKTSFSDRAKLMHAAAALLRDRENQLAVQMAEEMGKVIKDGIAEARKCADCCDFYAENAYRFLQKQLVESEAEESYVAYDPLGVILAIMPWNFPFWQVFRFAAPALMAGNTGVLKHASNVTGCALAIQAIFRDAGFPENVFTVILAESARVERLIRHPLVRAVTLTGSTPAGRSVASIAGSELKKSVLELGGSDAYLVLEDADLDVAVETCVQSRLINAGQSCIAAKRFIVVRQLFREFERRYVEKFSAIRYGDPKDAASHIGPMARVNLRDQVHEQVMQSVAQGARLRVGGTVPDGPGAYYPPTVLSGVQPGMTAFDEEIFGPVAALIEAEDEQHAITLANQSVFGLGSAIFSADKTRADQIAREIQAGSVFVNALVKSDPRLPFGGVKQSGYGRELSWFGIQEFVNVKTVYHASVVARPASGHSPVSGGVEG